MEAIIKCACGTLQGAVGPLSLRLNKRIVCRCNDCQAFAHYLGHVDRVLDVQGGTEIIGIHPNKIRFTKGAEKLTCIRLSDDGMRRWFTSCCNTPVANTHPKNFLPFAGVHRSILVLPNQNSLGQVYARINGKSPQGTLRASLAALRFIAVGFLYQLQKPWPFPDVEPLVGTDSEYDALIKKVNAS